MMNNGSIRIDGIEVPFESGQTIMDAALAAGIYIPHLCHKPGLSPHGSCKLCTVNLNGRGVSACTLSASDGMEVENNTPELTEARKSITRMLFVEGNHICPSCEKSGNCTLQALGYHFGMLDAHFPLFYPKREVDASHPAIILDRDRCIMCALCVRASREVDGKNVFEMSGRGSERRLIVNSESGQLGDSELKPDDLAARICPVGAILIREEGYETPLGERTYDTRSVAESDLGEILLTKKAADDA